MYVECCGLLSVALLGEYLIVDIIRIYGLALKKRNFFYIDRV